MAVLAWRKPLLPPCETHGSRGAPSVIPHIPSQFSQGMSHAGIKTTYKGTHNLFVDQDCAKNFEHLMDSLISGACIPH